MKSTAIIACGGSSTRMGTDKSRLNYHGIEQRYYLFKLLKTFFDDVFISCNSSQASTLDNNYAFIIDKPEYTGHGPVSGLLSAFSEIKNQSIFFIGCDYPSIDKTHIRLLLASHSGKIATSFINSEGMPEPLLTIYNEECGQLILERFDQKKYSLREFLISYPIQKILPLNPAVLKSVDTLEEYQSLKTKSINSGM
jgi:molybdopterin-guanine dinucleotide biosynthesis protein A